MNTSKITKEIQSLKKQLEVANGIQFIILHGEEDKKKYTPTQLKNAHIIEIIAKED